jgi:hypothetical protein
MCRVSTPTSRLTISSLQCASLGSEIQVGAEANLPRKDFHLPYLRLVSDSREGAEHRARRGDDFEVTEREAGAALQGV